MTDTRAQQCRGGSSAGAMLLVLIISRGLERSTDAALVVAEHEGALMDPWILDPQTAGETQNFLESTPLSFLRAGPPNFRRISAESRAHPNFDKKFAKLGPRPREGVAAP